MSKPKRDKTTGLPLPSPVVPVTSICYTILVPNALEYRTAFKGVLSELGKAWTWRQTAGEENEGAYQAAELWRQRIANANYDLDCEAGMSCDDVADCIDESEAVQTSINNLISTGGGQQTVYQTTVLGAPMTSAQRNTAVGTSSGDCEPDSLFGSVTSVVDQIHQNNVDFLELLLLSDNNQQRVSKVIKAIPLLNEVPIDEALDFVSQLTTEIKENYDAQYTSALRDTYRCDLFCAIKDVPPCELTFQALVEYFNNRIGTALEPINFFGSVVTYFIAGTWSGTTVCDIMSLIQLSAWQQASEWTGVSLRTLQTVGLLGANDPDPDWEIICEDCTPTPPDPNCRDLTVSADNWYGLSGFGEWIDGQGMAPVLISGTWYMARQRTQDGRPDARDVSSITIKGNQALAGMVFYSAYGSVTFAASVDEWTLDESNLPAMFPFNTNSGGQIGFTRPGNTLDDGSFRLIETCMTPA